MVLTAVQAGAHLHHLAFESADPQAMADFYRDIMQMEQTRISDDEWRCEGPERRMVIVRGEPGKLAYAGFALRDREGLDALRARAMAEGIAINDVPSPYYEDGAFAVRDPDGHTVCFGMAKADGKKRPGFSGALQHITLASKNPQAFEDFYHGKLGFAVSDRVKDPEGNLLTVFARSNHEHHTMACFKTSKVGVDHHCYETRDWNAIRDWCDHFSENRKRLVWGPGRHGPGNNLFAFIEDPDGNPVEVSAELEMMLDRAPMDWPAEERSLNQWGFAITRT